MTTPTTPITLGEFIIEKQADFPYSSGELSSLLSSIRLAARIVNREVNKAGIADILGAVGTENIQGEAQQRLDVFAHDAFINALVSREVVCAIASEEEENYIPVAESRNGQDNKYIVLIDPLDGSSNIDVNISIGTIFSIYRRVSEPGTPVQLEDLLQPGNKQVAAGYVLYGSSTILVYTTGNGVNGFTLDPSIGTFYLSHPNMQFPKDGNIYSINEGNYVHFPMGVKQYIKYCQEKKDNRPYTSRYVGSLVADFHRNMVKGGIYIYPSGTNHPKGKLRLLYECNPMAFIAEQAGGVATNGVERILDIKPTELHQRVPFFCGSENMMKVVDKFLQTFSE